MNVDTYNAKPLYEGTVSGRESNAFVNRDGDVWYRVEGERFLAAESEGLAIENHFASKFDDSVSLIDLQIEHPEGRLVYRP